MTHHPSADGHALRVGDRITTAPGKALSGLTQRSLTSGLTIEVSRVHREYDDIIDVDGVPLTARGARRAGLPARRVILPPGSYTTPIRTGDTVRYPPTGETPVVAAIHLRPGDGTALADLLFAAGSTSTGTHLADLKHLARPPVTPAVQPCKRRHDPALACNRCAEADEPITTGCDGPLCQHVADNLVVDRSGTMAPPVRAWCSPHVDAFIARHPGVPKKVFQLAEGTSGYVADNDGTQIATCLHCGHAIFLYAMLRGRREPWRAGQYDETGRCAVAEERHAVRAVHEPAVTLAERDYARAASTCATTADLHPIGDCPARRS